MSETTYTTDAVIIGAGPVGLFAVFACGMVRIHCHVVDTLESVGGQLTTLYPEKPIFDVPGYPRILASELIDRLMEQAAPFSPTFHLGHQVEQLEQQPCGRFLLTTTKQMRLMCRVVIIAAGAGSFGPNRPPLMGLEKFEGKSVFYRVYNQEDFREQRVVIAGGGDAAVDWALSLLKIAKRVVIVHRRVRFRATPDSVSRLYQQAQAGNLDLIVPYQLYALEGQDGLLSAVIVSTLDGKIKHLQADILLPFFGLTQDLGVITNFGLALKHHHIITDPSTSMTSKNGVFAIGDVATYPGKLKLILVGFSEAVRAAHTAYTFVYPQEAFHFKHSTERGIQRLST